MLIFMTYVKMNKNVQNLASNDDNNYVILDVRMKADSENLQEWRNFLK